MVQTSKRSDHARRYACLRNQRFLGFCLGRRYRVQHRGCDDFYRRQGGFFWDSDHTDGTRAYVTNIDQANSVSVIDTVTNTVVATIPIAGPFGVAITPDGTHAYVTNVGSNTVSVINTATNTVATTIAVGSSPEGVAITPDGARAYVTNNTSNTVSVIDTATNAVVMTIPVGSSPAGVATSAMASSGTPLSMGPQAMEGDLKLNPGDSLRVEFDFTMPGSHLAATLGFAAGQVGFQYTCTSGSGAGTLAVQFGRRSYPDSQGNSNWIPSGNQGDPSVYQGSLTVPDLCSGSQIRFQQGGTFTTAVCSNDSRDKVNVRWHYSGNGSAGGWSGTKSVVPNLCRSGFITHSVCVIARRIPSGWRRAYPTFPFREKTRSPSSSLPVGFVGIRATPEIFSIDQPYLGV